MRFEAIVFDYDGTLIRSAEAKHEAFYRLFPDEPAYREVVAAILASDPDGSRHDVIPRMVATMTERGLALPMAYGDTDRIGTYAQAVFAAQSGAAECDGASEMLRNLCGRAALYISSNTPEVDLATLLERRGWIPYIAAWFGHPRDKSATLAALIARHGGDPTRIAVVGDGSSDERAAAAHGCPFFRAGGPVSLSSIVARLESATHA